MGPLKGFFDETIVDDGGDRLFVKYEQCFQIATIGPKKSRRKFYLCVTKKMVREVDK